MEVWKDVPGYEGLYQASNIGRIKSLVKWDGNHWTKEKIMSFHKDKKGYIKSSLSKDGKHKTIYVHQIICKTFIPSIENKPHINHKDGNKQDNSVNNLEWCTQQENNIHRFKVLGYKISDETKKKMSLRMRGKNNPMYGTNRSGINAPTYKGKIICLNNNKIYDICSDACKDLNISASAISNVLNNKRKQSKGYIFKWCKENI
jgi:hypothetical protein